MQDFSITDQVQVPFDHHLKWQPSLHSPKVTLESCHILFSFFYKLAWAPPFLLSVLKVVTDIIALNPKDVSLYPFKKGHSLI